MENKTPTAEEFLIKENLPIDILSGDDINYAMVAFAKLHVEAALKEASEDAMLKVVNTEEFRDIEEGEDLVDSYECGSDLIHISASSILNAYPLTLIK